MITRLHNCTKLLSQSWCTTSCSSMSGNYCLVWFTLMQPGCERGDNCGAKCCRGWQDPFLDLSGGAVIERVMPESMHTQADELFTPTCLHTCGHARTHTHIGKINCTPHRDDCLLSLSGCAFFLFCFFFSSHGDLILGNWAISDWKQCR